MSGYEAYQQIGKPFKSGTEIEAQAFIKAASLLEEARGDMKNRSSLQDAISFTRKLWTILQADVSSSQSSLKDALKADLLSLSLYVDKKTVEVCVKPSRSGLDVLIDINRNVARGLLAVK